MDQVKIGKFIAQMRKEQNLTQRGLADKLSISDKTVSKWERGRGLPEVSLMLPLCGALGITVNDLLTGQRVAEADYQTRAEENMMNLLRENTENKKRMALSVICGCVTVIAVCALVALASFLEVAAGWRVALLALALLTAAAGIAAAAMLEASAGYYQCPSCQELFVPTMGAYVKGYHTLTKRRLKCPHAGRYPCASTGSPGKVKQRKGQAAGLSFFFWADGKFYLPIPCFGAIISSIGFCF